MVNKPDRLTTVFAALADPTRRRILERLSARGECRVTTLAKPFRMSLPAISRHLRVMEAARLIKREVRGRVHLICANPEGLKTARNWIARYAEFWDAKFDALDEFLKSEQSREERHEFGCEDRG
jgi:DNA-binding transcriptional ArsR family regulator